MKVKSIILFYIFTVLSYAQSDIDKLILQKQRDFNQESIIKSKKQNSQKHIIFHETPLLDTHKKPRE